MKRLTMMPSGFARTMVRRDVRFIFWGLEARQWRLKATPALADEIEKAIRAKCLGGAPASDGAAQADAPELEVLKPVAKESKEKVKAGK